MREYCFPMLFIHFPLQKKNTRLKQKLWPRLFLWVFPEVNFIFLRMMQRKNVDDDNINLILIYIEKKMYNNVTEEINFSYFVVRHVMLNESRSLWSSICDNSSISLFHIKDIHKSIFFRYNRLFVTESYEENWISVRVSVVEERKE